MSNTFFNYHPNAKQLREVLIMLFIFGHYRANSFQVASRKILFVTFYRNVVLAKIYIKKSLVLGSGPVAGRALIKKVQNYKQY